MAYSSVQISDILLKADKTMYKLGDVAYENMFDELDEAYDYERDIIFIYKKAVEYGDNYFVGTLKLDQIVERLAAKLNIYDYGTLAPIYVDVYTQVDQGLNIIYVLKTTALDLGPGLTGSTDFSQSQIDIDIDYTYLNNVYVIDERTLTINGVTYDLSSNRTWTLNLDSVTDQGSVTTNSITVGSVYLTNMTAGSGALYYGVGANRLTLANYNAGGSVYIEVNGGQYSAVFGSDLSFTSYGTIAGVFNNATVDTDKFIVSDGGVLKYRTGTQLLSDIGAQGALTLTTTGTSGPATLIANTLNIPNYGSALTGYVPYTGATQDLDLGTYGLISDFVRFNTSSSNIPSAEGVMSWNSTDGTVYLSLKGNTYNLPIGQSLVARVVNNTGAQLNRTDYRVVRVSSAQGQRLAVSLAQANNDANSADTLGIVCENISNNQEGFVVNVGQITEINTTGSLQGETWVDGDPLYLSATTPGVITNIKPVAPSHSVRLGYVEYAHSQHGKIYVKIDNGYELDELHDVEPTPYVNKGVLYRDTTLNLWKSATIQTLLGYTPANQATTLTINGTTYDLSANRTWNVGTVTGTGSTNYIPKFTNSSELGSSQIYDNGTNVGVGTTVPNFKLNVYNPVSNSNNYIAYENPDSIVVLGINSSNVGIVGAVYNRDFAFITNATERARITNGGNFLIGYNIDLGYKLYVNGSIGTNGSITIGNGGTGISRLNALSGSDLYLNVGGDRIAILQSGNVAIGSTSASYKLDVSGTGRFTNTLTIDTIANATVDTDKFLVSDGGVVKYRTGAQILSDIGAQAAGSYVTTSRQLTINGTAYDWSADRSWSVGTITSLTGEATGSGTGAVSVTLDNTAVIGKVLTGLNLSGGGTIVSTDSILQAFGKVQNQISALVGGVMYKGVWDANVNSPSLTSSVGNKGDYYIVNVAGSTNLNGITDWRIGDWAIFNGSTWDKVDNTDAVSSVNTFTGAVSLTTANIPEVTNLYYTDARARAAITLTTNGSSGSATYVGGTLNVPTYTLSGLGGVPTGRTLTINGTAYDLSLDRTWNVGTVTSATLAVGTSGTDVNITNPTITSSGTITLNIPTASATNRGLLSSADWTKFNNNIPAGVPSVGDYVFFNGSNLAYRGIIANSPLSYNSSTATFSISQASGSTNGYLSSTDWTTFNNKQNALTNPVTGTGTTNYVTKWTSSSAVGNSQIFDNGTNIGIGTTSVSGTYEKLAVAGGISIKDNTNAKLEIGRYNTSGAQNSYIKLGANSNSLRFTNNTDVADIMELTNSGNLGLGVTPSAWNSTFNVFQIGSTGSLYSRTSGIEQTGIASNAYFASGTNDWRYITSTNATYYLQSGGVHYWLNAASGTAGNAISFTQAMTLTAGGNLQLGTTSGATHRILSYTSTSSGTGSALFVRQDGSDPIAIFSYLGQILMQLNSTTGNLGIGTTNPQAKLEILGTSSDQLRLSTASTEHYRIGRNASTGYLDFYGSQTGYTGYTFGGVDGERLRITSGGNLLVGTTTDNGAKLQVSGDITINTGTADGGQLILCSSGYSNWNLDNFSGSFRAYYGSTEYLRLTSAGNLQIGSGSIKTAAPTGYTAGAWKLGTVNTGTVTTNRYITIEIDGQIYTFNALLGTP